MLHYDERSAGEVKKVSSTVSGADAKIRYDSRYKVQNKRLTFSGVNL